MFHEYALDPAVISTWDRARFFLDAFGPWKGRFLAEYPRRWKRMVYDGLNCGPLEKKRIEERLASFDRRAFSPRSHAPYDGSRTWIENAITEHGRLPFRAIVAPCASGPCVVDADVCDEQCALWRVESGCLFPRDPAAFAGMLRLLLMASKRILIIDPYFRADQNDKTRVLAALCRTVTDLSVSVEVHFDGDVRDYSVCIRDAERALPRLLPVGREITLRGWQQRTGGPRLHNRYVLTDIGGVKFGDGIEAGDAGHEDHVSILDEPSRMRLWSQYASDQPGFDSAGPPRTILGAALFAAP